MSPERFPLSDRQSLAIEIQDRDLLVTAGAGAGKTTVLVERVLHKLRQGAVRSLEELLIVTFTEKAAQEMKDRLAQELRSDPALRSHLTQLPRCYISTIHGFCARLLREHFLAAGCEPGFRVLDESGSREALSEALNKAFHDWYALGQKGLGRSFQSLVEMTQYGDEGEVLRDLVLQLYKYARVTDDPEGYLERLLTRPTATTIKDLPWYSEMARQLCGPVLPESAGARSSPALWSLGLELYRGAISIARDAGLPAAKMEAFDETLSAISVADLADPDRQIEIVRSLLDSRCAEEKGGFALRFPTAPNGAGKLPGFAELHDAAKATLRRPLITSLPWDPALLLQEDKDQRKYLEVLVALVRETDAHYTLYKNRGGLLDFSDLEIKAARLIRGHGEELGLSTRFREVLVDEFQDVNPLQNVIVSSLSPSSGRFRVGDVKQSIYQFRLADPTIFLAESRIRRPVRSKAEIPAGDEPLLLMLAENHRSRAPILHFANHVFSHLFDEASIGSAYGDQALIPGRPKDGGEAPVELHLLEKGSSEEPLPGSWTTPLIEAYYTARRLHLLIKEEAPEIPLKNGVRRPARWGDVAILLRSRSRAATFLEALQAAGIPAFLAEGESLLEEDAVRDFRCLLTVIDNPRDDVSFAALLRSPLYGIRDAELLSIRWAWPEAHGFLDACVASAYFEDPEKATGIYWAITPVDEGTKRSTSHGTVDARTWSGAPSPDLAELLPGSLRTRLRRILDQIQIWRDRSGRMELRHFLRSLCEETHLVPSLLARGDIAGARISLEKFLALARAYEEERGPSLHGFLNRIGTMESAGGIPGVPAVAEEEDAVRILTIHKAKGLEFPIVLIPQLSWAPPANRLGQKIRIGRKWVGLRTLDNDSYSQKDTSARRVLEEMQDEEQTAEEKRILYVALTRARERLILVGSPRKRIGSDESPPDPGARALLLKQRLRAARSALDWILAVLPGADGSFLQTTAVPQAAVAADIHGWLGDEISPLRGLADPAGGRGKTDQGVIDAPAPGPGSLGASSEIAATVKSLVERIGRESPFAPIDRLPDIKGKYWVTELKGLADRGRAEELAEEGSGVLFGGEAVTDLLGASIAAETASSAGGQETAEATSTGDAEAAAQRGLAYHAALSRLDLGKTSPDDLDRQFAAFALTPWWGGIVRDPEIEQGIARFFESDLGRDLTRAARQDPAQVERETTFSCKWTIAQLLPWIPGLCRTVEEDARWRNPPWSVALEETWVLLQGRIDCLYGTGSGWRVIDWKTDRVTERTLPERVASYAPQMAMYKDAVSKLWGGGVECWVVFVRGGLAAEVT